MHSLTENWLMIKLGAIAAVIAISPYREVFVAGIVVGLALDWGFKSLASYFQKGKKNVGTSK